jgi:hypothetical protein
MRSSWVALSVVSLLATATGVSIVQTGCQQNNYVPQSRFAQEYAQALCTALQHCCAENNVGSNYAQCTAGWETAVNNLLSSAGGNYNGTAGTQCVQQVQAAANASCQPGPGTLSDARATCQQVFAGQAPPGAPCSSASQCAPQDGSIVTCAIVPSDGGTEAGGGQLPLSAPTPGLVPLDFHFSPQDTPVCVVEPLPGDAGGPAPCSFNVEAGVDTCASGTYCDPASSTCLPVNAAGAPCDPGVLTSCQPGNYCVSGGAANATCAAAGPAGSPCTSSVQCDATSTCDPGSHQCVARSQPGASCSSGDQCSIGVCDSVAKTCLTNAIATTNACNGVP